MDYELKNHHGKPLKIRIYLFIHIVIPTRYPSPPISLPPPYPIIGNQRFQREDGNDGVPRQLEEGADPLFDRKVEG